MASPPGLFNMIFGHHRASRAMESGAVDQTGLKCLQLLPGNDVIMNVDDHGAMLSAETASEL